MIRRTVMIKKKDVIAVLLLLAGLSMLLSMARGVDAAPMPVLGQNEVRQAERMGVEDLAVIQMYMDFAADLVSDTIIYGEPGEALFLYCSDMIDMPDGLVEVLLVDYLRSGDADLEVLIERVGLKTYQKCHRPGGKVPVL
jgi:hypothetical protein